MCKFCEALKNKNNIEVSVRSTYVDDNTCEYLVNNDCSSCGECNMKFVLNAHEIDEDHFVCMNYEQTMMNGKFKIHPFSEGIQFNYCPICGTQISKNLIDFEDISSHKIEIIED